MFRSTKRKPPKVVNRSALRGNEDSDDDEDEQDVGPTSSSARQRADSGEEEDEEEESPVVIIRRHKDKKSFASQKKRKETRSLKRGVDAVAPSFQADMEEEDDPELPSSSKKNKEKKKKKRGKGLGFGGGMTMVIDEDGDDEILQSQPPELQEAPVDTAPAYGKEALDALKAEQKLAKPKELEKSIATDMIKDSIGEGAKLDANEENFISLHGIADATEHDPTFMETERESSRPVILEDPDDDNWEEQVAKRAGIQTAPTNASARPSIPTNTPTLDILRQNLQDTVQHLAIREEDLGHAIMRREADFAQTQADRKRQQDSIEGAGKACGDYQKLRYELAMWVGALRDLCDKVTPIQTSLLDMVSLQFETAHQGWLHWQDDVCATLREFQLLDRVLGRAPPDLSTEETETQLDEFGRDVGSQVRRDRENRCRRRRHKQEEVLQKEGADHKDQILDFLWTKEEAAERRYDILQEALRVAMDDLDDTYSSPNGLEECFASWKNDYSDEYRQCYADISFADLAHVFEQVDLCRATWIRGFLKSNDAIVTEGKLFPKGITIPQDNEDSETAATSPMERAYRKKFVPFVVGLLRECPSAIFLSKRMSRLFCGSLFEVMTRMGQESVSTKELCSAIAKAGSSVLNSLSIPILKPQVDNSELPVSNDRLDDSVRFVKSQQSQWIQDLFVNMLVFWMPVLQRISREEYENLGRSVLGFLSESYLYYLSSMSSGQMAMEHLAPIWKSLTPNYQDLLESPDFILQSAPLRAAASAYGLSSLS